LEIGRDSARHKQYYQTDLCTRPEPNGEFLPWRDATYYEREDRIIVTAGCMPPLAAGEPSPRGQALRVQLDPSAPSPNHFPLPASALPRCRDGDSCGLLVLGSAQLAGERRFAHLMVHGSSEPKSGVSLLP